MNRSSLGLATLLLALALTGCASPPPAAEHASDHLDVMTFNIRYGTARDGDDAWPHRRALVFDVIRRHDPDVLGLQEALRFQLDELADAFPDYAELGVGRRDGRADGEYAAILYRRARLRPEGGGTFWFSDTPDVPGSMSWGNGITRIATWARFTDRRTEQTFLLYNLHLDHESRPSRERSVQLLAERIAGTARAGEPVIVTGDFNAGEDTRTIRFVLGEPPALVDTFRAVHPNALDVGTFNGFTGRRDGAKIDYVFASPSVRVLDASIVRDADGARYPSDHFPVTARVRLPATSR